RRAITELLPDAAIVQADLDQLPYSPAEAPIGSMATVQSDPACGLSPTDEVTIDALTLDAQRLKRGIHRVRSVSRDKLRLLGLSMVAVAIPVLIGMVGDSNRSTLKAEAGHFENPHAPGAAEPSIGHAEAEADSSSLVSLEPTLQNLDPAPAPKKQKHLTRP